nr:chloride anion exchanger-like [Cherax quadricarinatus]
MWERKWPGSSPYSHLTSPTTTLHHPAITSSAEFSAVFRVNSLPELYIRVPKATRSHVDHKATWITKPCLSASHIDHKAKWCKPRSFAIMCLMTGKIVKQLAVMPEDPEAPYDDNITDSFLTIDDKQTYTPVQVAAIVALTNGFAQILLGIMQMGSLCVYLSDMMVSGFTTGASVHVLASQIPFLLGIHTRSFDGPLKIIYIFIEIFTLIFTSNPAVMVISVFTLTAMIFSNEIIKPWCRTITKLPIPAEFIVVAVGTLASYFGKFKDTYHVKIVGEIPTGYLLSLEELPYNVEISKLRHQNQLPLKSITEVLRKFHNIFNLTSPPEFVPRKVSLFRLL